MTLPPCFFILISHGSYKKITHQFKEGLDIADLDLDGDLDLIMNGFWFEAPDNPIEEDFIFHNIDDKWYTQNEGIWQDNNCYVGSADLNQDGITGYYPFAFGKNRLSIVMVFCADPRQG